MRNEKIEEILEAWWELIMCAPDQREEALKKRNALLDRVISGTNFTREQVLQSLSGHFREFRKSKKVNPPTIPPRA